MFHFPNILGVLICQARSWEIMKCGHTTGPGYGQQPQHSDKKPRKHHHLATRLPQMHTRRLQTTSNHQQIYEYLYKTQCAFVGLLLIPAPLGAYAHRDRDHARATQKLTQISTSEYRMSEVLPESALKQAISRCDRYHARARGAARTFENDIFRHIWPYLGAFITRECDSGGRFILFYRKSSATTCSGKHT